MGGGEAKAGGTVRNGGGIVTECIESDLSGVKDRVDDVGFMRGLKFHPSDADLSLGTPSNPRLPPGCLPYEDQGFGVAGAGFFGVASGFAGAAVFAGVAGSGAVVVAVGDEVLRY